MGLSTEELRIVAETAGSYPVGTPVEAWGYGPMSDEIYAPDTYDKEVVSEYG